MMAPASDFNRCDEMDVDDLVNEAFADIVHMESEASSEVSEASVASEYLMPADAVLVTVKKLLNITVFVFYGR